MTQEAVNSYAFMIFGLGFFIFSMWMVHSWNHTEYRRDIREAREFGFEGSKAQRKALKIKIPKK